ncbi:MAG TPA: hypothetical protein EYG48_03280, partial [Methylococcales bacterium]|nr:hypothetical protein [Methylococcales bacterium]
SVHNAIAGLFSIAFKNNTESTVVAPGEEGIAAAFIEAAGLLQQGAEQVLIVLYDEPLLGFYPTTPFKLSVESSRAVALTLSKTGQGMVVRFSSQQSMGDQGDQGEQPLQIPLLIQFLAHKQTQLQIQNARHSWCWEKL